MSSSSSRGAPGVPVASAGDSAGGLLVVVRRFGVAALPLALAGVLPWWAVLLLCAVFAAGTVSAEWRQGQLLIGLLVAGLAVVPGVLGVLGGGGAGLTLFEQLRATYFLGLVGFVLLHWAGALLAGGNRVGLLLVVLVGLLAPQPWLVLALVGGALSLEGPDDRLGFRQEQSVGAREHLRSYALWLGAAVLLLVAVAFLLPRSQGRANHHQPAPRQESVTPLPTPEVPSPTASRADSPRERPKKTGLELQKTTHVPTPPLEWSLLMGGLMILALAFRLLSFRGLGRRKPSLLEWVMVGALLANIALFMLMAQSPGSGMGALPSPAGAASSDGAGGLVKGPEVVRRVVPVVMDVMNSLVWLSLIFQALLLAVVIYWALKRAKRAATEPNGVELLEPSTSSSAEVSGHRVRVAYRTALEALQGHGWGRLDSETPSRYAARLAGLHADFARPLGLLTSLYEPVRYGGRVTEQDAGQAEQAARELIDLAARHPFIPPDDQEQNQESR